MCVEPRVLQLMFNTVRMYFIEKQVSTVFVSALLQRLAKINFGTILGKTELRCALGSLATRFPEWIWFVPHSDGELLKMNRAKTPVAFEK